MYRKVRIKLTNESFAVIKIRDVRSDHYKIAFGARKNIRSHTEYNKSINVNADYTEEGKVFFNLVSNVVVTALSLEKRDYLLYLTHLKLAKSDHAND